MPNCFKCGEEITFNKNILSKTGKQIPLWADQQNTHGHDDNGQPIRGPLPTGQTTNYNMDKGMGVGLQHPQIKPQQPQFTPETRTGGLPGPSDRPSLEGVLLNQINTAISTLTSKVIEIEKRVIAIGEKVDYNTQVDTDKLIGQLQTIEDTIAPFLKTQIKIGTDLYDEQQKKEAKERDDKYQREQTEQKKWNTKAEGEGVVTDNKEEKTIEEDAL